jgi:uncharacterized membrane protein
MVTDDQAPPDTTFIAADAVHAPRLVVGDRGAGWIVESWDCFKAQPVQWVLLCVVGLVIMLVIDFIPVVNIINNLFKPAWFAGLMLACHAQHTGKQVEVRHLFAGFGNKLGPLVLCGLLQSVLSFIVVIVTMGPLILQIFRAVMPNEVVDYSDLTGFMAQFQDRLRDMARNNPYQLMAVLDFYSIALHMLIMLAVLIPIWAMFWFAPALIVLGNKDLIGALQLSFIGTLKNSWPFLIYGFCGLVLCLLTPITLFLGLIVLVPMFFLSTYLSYRDIYID